ncbi:MAG: FeoB small GTPase domain-containing protein [Syntrophomonas sp.]
MRLLQEMRNQTLSDDFGIKPSEGSFIIALAGNPNVGKSTIFNAMTGLRQHTGNWPGKTVGNAQGTYIHKGRSYLLVDLPGTYSLLSNSVEEEIARDFICFGQPDATIVVVDATCLERNLNLALQVMEISSKVVVCVNLLDEAHKKDIYIDMKTLADKLGVPIIGTVARAGQGLEELRDAVYSMTAGTLLYHPFQITYSPEVEELIGTYLPRFQNLKTGPLNPRWVMLRMMEGDQGLINKIFRYIEHYSYMQTSKEASL